GNRMVWSLVFLLTTRPMKRSSSLRPPDGSGWAVSESGRSTPPRARSADSWVVIMKNIRICRIRSRSAVKFGSQRKSSDLAAWLMAATSLGLDGSRLGADGAGVGHLGDGGPLRAGRLLRVVVHLGQQVVGDVASVHGQADQAVAEEGVEEDGRHRQGDAEKGDDQRLGDL